VRLRDAGNIDALRVICVSLLCDDALATNLVQKRFPFFKEESGSSANTFQRLMAELLDSIYQGTKPQA
jgi:hypothetical protein